MATPSYVRKAKVISKAEMGQQYVTKTPSGLTRYDSDYAIARRAEEAKSRGTGATPRAREILEIIDPQEAAKVTRTVETTPKPPPSPPTTPTQPGQESPEQRAARMRAQVEKYKPEQRQGATSAAARVIKDNPNIMSKSEQKKTWVSASRDMSRFGITNYESRVSEGQFQTFQAVKYATGSESAAYAAIGRPEPYYAPEQKSGKIGAAEPDYKEYIKPSDFRRYQAEAWAQKRAEAGISFTPEGTAQQTPKHFTTWETIKNPDAAFAAYIARENLGEKYKTNALFRATPTGRLMSYSEGVRTVTPAISFIGKQLQRPYDYYVSQFGTETFKNPTPMKQGVQVFSVVGRALEGEAQNLQEKPIGTGIRIGVTYGLGAGVGAIEGAIAGSTVTGFGAQATKYVWRAGAVGVSALYAGGQYGEYKKAETDIERKQVTGETATDLFTFGLGAQSGYKAVRGGSASRTDTPPPDMGRGEAPSPSGRAEAPRQPSPSGRAEPRFDINEYSNAFSKVTKFSDRTITEYFATSPSGKTTQITKNEFGRVSIRDQINKLSIRGKSGTARTPEFLVRSRTRTAEPTRPSTVTERGLRETGRDVMKVESGKDLMKNNFLRELTRARARPSYDMQTRETRLPSPRNQQVDVFKPSTQITPRSNYPIQKRPEYPIRERPEYPIRERPRSELVEQRPRPEPRPPEPRPRPPPPGDGGGWPFDGGWGSINIGAGGGLLGNYKRGSKVKGRKGRYTPSQASIEFGIYGTAPTGTLTGLEERPLPGKPGKKRKRKNLFNISRLGRL